MAQPGLELLYSSVVPQLKCSEDAVICVLHWNIVSNGFKCSGNGDKVSANAKQSELLPSGWNGSSDLYVLSYKHSETGEDFVLKVVRIDNSLLVHFMRSKDEKVTSMNIRVSNYTTGDLTAFDAAYKNLDELQQRIKADVLKEFQTKPAASTSTSQPRQQRQPLYEDDPLRVPSRRQQPPPDWMPSSDPFAVGRGDLDPLAGGMGGMLMDPRRSGGRLGPDPNAGLPGRLPPGAVPPGARFDPFGPPGRPGPDPDHMAPPGYDDMFM